MNDDPPFVDGDEGLLITAEEENGLLGPSTPPVDGQINAFGDDREFHKHWSEWKGLPEYEADDLSGRLQLVVNFRSSADRDAFAKLIGQRITPFTPSIWHPKAEIDEVHDLRWREAQPRKPKLAGTTAQKRAKTKAKIAAREAEQEGLL